MSFNKPTIRVEYNADQNKFYATCPFALNHIMRKVPSRSFLKARRQWVFKPLRANCKALESVIGKYVTLADATTRSKFDEVLASEIKVNHSRFPTTFPFKTTPAAKQLEALNHLYGQPGRALLSKPGTGKSKMEIDLVACAHAEGRITHWLILCPFAVKSNWLPELEKHCPIEFSAHVIKTDKKTEIAAAREFVESDHPFKIAIAGIESLNQQDQDGRGRGNLYEILISFMTGGPGKPAITVDESHLIKNHKSNRTENIKKLAAVAVERCIMTGTVIANTPMDAFSQYDFLGGNILGLEDFYSFKTRYAEMGGYENRQIVAYQNLDELAEIVAPVTFSCELRDMFDMPDCLFPEPIRFVMTPAQKEAYNMVVKDGLIKIGDSPDDTHALENVLQVYLALQQIVNGYFSYAEFEDIIGTDKQKKISRIKLLVEPKKNPKFLAAQGVLDQLSGEQALVWSKFRPTLDSFPELIGYQRCAMYHGGVDEEERDINKANFMQGKREYFVGNPSVGGVGLNGLQDNCHYALYLDNSFKLIDRTQSIARLDRKGQGQSSVFYDFMPQEKSVDELIYSAIGDKKDVSVYVEDNMREAINAIRQI